MSTAEQCKRIEECKPATKRYFRCVTSVFYGDPTKRLGAAKYVCCCESVQFANIVAKALNERRPLCRG